MTWTGGGSVVKKNGPLPALGKASRAFGGNRRVEIATRLQFVGRRPQVQESLRAGVNAGQDPMNSADVAPCPEPPSATAPAAPEATH